MFDDIFVAPFDRRDFEVALASLAAFFRAAPS